MKAPGLFDDGPFGELLPPKPADPDAPTTAEMDSAARAAAAIAALDAPPAPAAARAHPCTRCEKAAHEAQARGQFPQPIAEAESWFSNGYRHWSALCGRCADVDWAERWQRKYDAAQEAKDHAEMKRLTDAVYARQTRTGRTVPLHPYVDRGGSR